MARRHFLAVGHFTRYATEWDKFHREDRRIARSIAACALAEETFEVAQLMDVLFGHGDGRLLLRTAAEMADTTIRRGAMPGLTRKGAGLTREPGQLLDNLPAYAVGLRGKVAHKREGRHGPNLGILTEAGRRLTAVDFVAFAAGFRDVLQRVVAPWVADTQKSSMEPWVLNRKMETHTSQLMAYRRLIHSTRRMLRVLVLLRSHVPLRDLRELIRALMYARPSQFFTDHRGQRVGALVSGSVYADELTWGRGMPVFWFSLRGFLNERRPSFRGVELLCEPDASKQDLWCLSPHCQCSFLAGRGQSRNPQKVPMPQALRGRFPRHCRNRTRRRLGVPTMPAWVANSVALPRPHQAASTHRHASWIVDEYGQAMCDQIVRFCNYMDARLPADAGGDADRWVLPALPVAMTTFKVPQEAGLAPLRYHYRHPDNALPRGIAPEGKFRPSLRVQDGGVVPRCRVHPRLPVLMEDLDNALVGLAQFIRSMQSEGDKLYGDEGVNAGMRRAVRAMNLCFDWQEWIVRRPTRQCIDEFGKLCEMLRPLLRQTRYPSPTVFPDVNHAWPDDQAIS